MPRLQRYSYADVLSDLDGIDDWLQRLGLVAKQDRIHFAIEVLRRAEENFRQSGGRQPEVIGNNDDFIFGVCEALEIRDIYRAFNNEPKERIAPILDRALSGPHRPADENEQNADGRNIGFELAFGADLRLRGANVELEEPDLRLSIDGHTYLLACKRPRRAESIRACIRDAVRQLRTSVVDEANQQASGIIAISVGRILNPGTHYFTAHLEVLGDRVLELLEANKNHGRRAARDVPAICAVLFHIATPGEVEGILTRMSYVVMYDAGVPSAAFDHLADHIAPMYEV
ncbi:MAG TPA: hypothetical protein VGK24_22105 [Candidatus Angelobacter sp.]|jgi:hypothetical protein